MFGRNDCGQLGLGTFEHTDVPQPVQQIGDFVTAVSCGERHTLILTQSGHVYAMGSNLEGQLGLKNPKSATPGQKAPHGQADFAEPELIHDLKFNKVVQIRAGQFSAALTEEQQLYVWGKGVFGEFRTPHRVKASNKLDIKDFGLSTGGIAVILTKQGALYAWGENHHGQLGLGDCEQRRAPQKIEYIGEKLVRDVQLGHAFVMALGENIPARDYEKALSLTRSSRRPRDPRRATQSGSLRTKRTHSAVPSHTRTDVRSHALARAQPHSSRLRDPAGRRLPMVVDERQRMGGTSSSAIEYTVRNCSPLREGGGRGRTSLRDEAERGREHAQTAYATAA